MGESSQVRGRQGRLGRKAPNKYELVVNLEGVLARADAMIES